MKHLAIYLVALLTVNTVQAEEMKPARIQGKIKDFAGGNVLMYYNEKIDTLSVDKNGVFDYSVVVENPQGVFLVFEEYKCSINLFIENGMNARLTISFVQEPSMGMMIYKPQFVYEGDNGDCTQFTNDYEDWSLYKSPWPFSRIDTLSFAEYREKFQEDVDSVKSELMKVKSRAFKRIMAEEIDRSIPANLFRFAWSELRNDADFEQFAESFDRNDVDNIDMAERYLRHYLRHHPAPKGQKGTHYLISLKQVFTNQEVIDAFADDYIDGYLKQAPEDMEAVLDVYKKISTNTKAHVSAEAVYAHYKNLRKGADALDFEMTDEKGKKCRLSDFRGKAVYIDVWATWCGPCRAEIPYLVKLEKEMEGKDVVFIGVLIDQKKDHRKWLEVLEQEGLSGVQLFAGVSPQIMKDYKFTTIPRFMVFDREGKVVTTKSPRPSSPELKKLLEKLLNSGL